MKAVRVDETVIKLAVQMTPDEAETLRDYLMRSLNGELRADQREVLEPIFQAIGRVF